MLKLNLNTMALGLLISVCAGIAQADVQKLVFDKALTLTGDNLAVSADHVKLKLDRDKNAWVEKNRDPHVQECQVKVQVEGRDLATHNQLLGEHYFGSMNLDCASGHGGKAFKTNFSRVLFLGIRNCVESETMVDQDYCKLVAVAMRRESDMTIANGDLIKNDAENREYIQINSAAARKNFTNLKLAPEGLLVDTLDSIQIFEFSVGQSGKDFFIGAQNPLANFAGGVNHYLSISAADQDRDQALGKKVDDSLSELESILSSVKVSSSPKDELNRVLPDYLAKFSTALKDLLALISPVEYFGREKRMKSIEDDMVSLSKTYFADTVTDRDSFVRVLGSKYAEYQRVAEYFGQKKYRVNYEAIAQPNADLESIVSAVETSPVETQSVPRPFSPNPPPPNLPPSLVHAAFNQIPARTKITLLHSVQILPETSEVQVAQAPDYVCVLNVINVSRDLREIAAGYSVIVTEASTGRPWARLAQNQVFSGLACRNQQDQYDQEDVNLTIGKTVELTSANLSFEFPAPQVISGGGTPAGD